MQGKRRIGGKEKNSDMHMRMILKTDVYEKNEKNNTTTKTSEQVKFKIDKQLTQILLHMLANCEVQIMSISV